MQGVKAFRMTYRSKLWMGKEQEAMHKAFLQMEAAYVRLATGALRHGLQRYRLVPKLHGISHMRYDIERCMLKGSSALSPLAASCEQDEDYIGRVSRLSRRVGIKLIMLRTLQRVLVASRLKLIQVKKTIGKQRGHL